MNQRRRPQMPPQGPKKNRSRPGHYWHNYPYWCWDDYYDWDYYDWDYDDWDYDYYGVRQPQKHQRQQPKNTQTLKLGPALMFSLLEYARTEAKLDTDNQHVVNNMMNISNSSWGEELTMSDYDEIVGKTMHSKPLPPQPNMGE